MKLFAPALLIALVAPGLCQDISAPAEKAAVPVLPEQWAPITGKERGRWLLKSTVGPRSLGWGIVVSGWNTGFNSPPEWGGSWEGFGKRYGNRALTIGISNSIEAAMGTLWAEDPRYRRSRESGLWRRTGYAAKTTLLAYHADGELHPAYARYLGVVGNNFIANSWLPPSSNQWQDALERVGWGLLGRFGDSMFQEFWPDVARLIHKKKRP
jgi:hypothetical protein